jgi:hypothetical protein
LLSRKATSNQKGEQHDNQARNFRAGLGGAKLELERGAGASYNCLVELLNDCGAKFTDDFNRDVFLRELAFALARTRDIGKKDGRFEQMAAVRSRLASDMGGVYE